MTTTLDKLRKTRTSLRSIVQRGATLRSHRAAGLCYRFNDLKHELVSTDAGADQWEAFCAELGSCPTHDGYDYFA